MGILDEVEQIEKKFEHCAKCSGVCLLSCEAYQNDNPQIIREISKNLKANTLSVDDAHIAYRCNLCSYCQTVCPQSLNVAELFYAARVSFCKSGQGPLSYHLPMLTNKRVNYFSLANKAALKKETYPKQADRIFFPGCALRTFRPDLVSKVSSYLGDALVMNNECCGKTLSGIGLEDEYDKHIASVVKQFKDLKPRQIITACPNCYTSFKYTVDFADVIFLEDILEEKIHNKNIPGNLGTVAIHNPCPFGQAPELFEISKKFVDSAYSGKRIDLYEPKDKIRCCGGGGGLSFSNEKLSLQISRARLQEARKAGVDTLITLCVSCAIQFGSVAKNEGIRVIHALDLLEPSTIPEYSDIYKKSRKQFSGGNLFVNLMRLSLQV